MSFKDQNQKDIIEYILALDHPLLKNRLQKVMQSTEDLCAKPAWNPETPLEKSKDSKWLSQRSMSYLWPCVFAFLLAGFFWVFEINSSHLITERQFEVEGASIYAADYVWSPAEWSLNSLQALIEKDKVRNQDALRYRFFRSAQAENPFRDVYVTKEANQLQQKFQFHTRLGSMQIAWNETLP